MICWCYIIFLVLNNTYEIVLLKQYSNEIKSLRFVYSCSALLISFIFDTDRENLARTVQDFNKMRWKVWWMKWYLNGAILPNIWVSPMPGCNENSPIHFQNEGSELVEILSSSLPLFGQTHLEGSNSIW